MSGVPFTTAIRRRAAGRLRRVVLPESWDARVLQAAERLARESIVEPVLVLDPARPESHAAALATGVEVVDPTSGAAHERAVGVLLERRGPRGMERAEAASLAATPLYFADAMVVHSGADACVAGAFHTTAEVLRAALWTVGPAPGGSTVSSAFYMVVPRFRDVAGARAGEGAGEGEVLTFTDCAVVRYPTAEQLADIALAAAVDRRRIVGDEPCVALLSFSTRGSAAGDSVDLVRAALARIREREPGLAVDGELQVDAALIRSVGERKAPGSPVAGGANVLVFPSLDAGNIGYKLVQRLAGAEAVGPVVQGLARPCCDLSRGASVDDIMNVAAIAALQAGEPPTP